MKCAFRWRLRLFSKSSFVSFMYTRNIPVKQHGELYYSDNSQTNAQSTVYSDTIYFKSKPLCYTLSKAFDIFPNIIQTFFFLSNASQMVCERCTRCTRCVVLHPAKIHFDIGKLCFKYGSNLSLFSLQWKRSGL